MNISWKHNNNTLNNDGNIAILRVNKKISTLSFDSVDANHIGEYTCIASNLAGTTSYSTNLLVNGTFTFSHCI